MNFEDFRAYCLAKPGVTESYPFKGECVWMKVAGKMFALSNGVEFKMGKEMVPPFHFMNLKCDPERAQELRASYPSIQAGWHQNKEHWNSVYPDGTLSDKFIEELIDHSYDLVVNSLPQKKKQELLNY